MAVASVLLALAGCGSEVDQEGRSCRVDAGVIDAREKNDRVVIELDSGAVSFVRFDGQPSRLAMRNLRRIEDRFGEQHLLMVLIEDERTLMSITDRACIAALDGVMRPSAEALSRSDAWSDSARKLLEAGDTAAGRAIIQEAASAGLDWAQVALGLMFKNGEGIAADPQQAVRWLELASSQNHPDAHYHLAGLYAQGHGGEEGKRRVRLKLDSAVALGHEAAKRLQSELREQTGR